MSKREKNIRSILLINNYLSQCDQSFDCKRKRMARKYLSKKISDQLFRPEFPKTLSSLFSLITFLTIR